MAAVLSFFVRYAPLVYLLLALGLIFGIRRMAQAIAEARQAIFGLEREIARRHTTQAVSVLSLIVILAVGEFLLSVILAPNLPALFRLTTPTLNLLESPTETLPPQLLETVGAATPGPSVTVEVTGCIPGQIAITAPEAGSEIKGQVTLKGTADIPNFGFYKYEFAPAGGDSWSTVEASRKPVRDGELGIWDTSAITPGDYQLRLVVTDNQGNALPACIVPVRIKAP